MSTFIAHVLRVDRMYGLGSKPPLHFACSLFFFRRCDISAWSEAEQAFPRCWTKIKVQSQHSYVVFAVELQMQSGPCQCFMSAAAPETNTELKQLFTSLPLQQFERSRIWRKKKNTDLDFNCLQDARLTLLDLSAQ